MDNKTVSFSVSMKTKYMFEFLYVNSYSGLRGLISYLFSAAGIAALIFGYGEESFIAAFFLHVLALMFTVLDPLLLLYKAWQQVKISDVFKEPINYSFTVNGFNVAQGENSQDLVYDVVLLAKETLGSIVLFTGNNNAIILPKEFFKENVNDLKQLLKKVRPSECAGLKIK